MANFREYRCPVPGWQESSLVAIGDHHLSKEMQLWLAAAEAHFKIPLGNLIISGFRSPEENKRLQEAWDKGLREGITTRPADRSYHLTGDAVDLHIESEMLQKELAKWWEARGGKWGGRFVPIDKPHFQLPRRTQSVFEINLV